jgi:hypothetical protein
MGIPRFVHWIRGCFPDSSSSIPPNRQTPRPCIEHVAVDLGHFVHKAAISTAKRLQQKHFRIGENDDDNLNQENDDDNFNCGGFGGLDEVGGELNGGSDGKLNGDGGHGGSDAVDDENRDDENVKEGKNHRGDAENVGDSEKETEKVLSHFRSHGLSSEEVDFAMKTRRRLSVSAFLLLQHFDIDIFLLQVRREIVGLLRDFDGHLRSLFLALDGPTSKAKQILSRKRREKSFQRGGFGEHFSEGSSSFVGNADVGDNLERLHRMLVDETFSADFFHGPTPSHDSIKQIVDLAAVALTPGS